MFEETLKTTNYKPYDSHKGFEVSSKKVKTPKKLTDEYGDYHIYHGTIKNKNGPGKEKKFVVHDRPLDYKFMHKDHSRDEKDAILHHLKKNGKLTEESELNEMDQKFIDSLNKLSHRHKEGDRVTVNSKFFGKQKGKVVKVDNQSIHVQRDGKKFSEKYPHNAVVGEDVSPLLHSVHKKADAVKNKDLNKFIKGHKQGKLIPEGGDLMGDPKSAEISPADGANGGQEIAEKRRQMSKSARIIKALYKKKGVVKEDMYDHEKEDKSVTTYGKKPKFDKAEKDDSIGEKKPTAAATLTGGTTLTGEKRDDVEIDPMMRNRPGQPEVGKKDDKKDGKKEDKKKDK